jgi:hypothetical protein
LIDLGSDLYIGNRKCEVFDDATETWSEYQERLDMYFEANDVKPEKKKAVLLSSCGKAAYKLVRGLVAPKKPSEKSYEELCSLFAKHYDPTPSEVLASYRFGTRHRQEGESVSSYVAELQRLSQHCGYGAMLGRMLRDQLVVGINNDRIQSRRLELKDLTFEKAKELAESLETASRSLDEIQSASAQVKAPKVEEAFGVKESCVHCGRRNHQSDNCFWKTAECRKCGEIGHISPVYPSKKAAAWKGAVTKPMSGKKSKKSLKVHKAESL